MPSPAPPSLKCCPCFGLQVVLGCPYSFKFWSQLSDARADGIVSPWIYLGVTAMLVCFNCLNVFWSYKVTLSPDCSRHLSPAASCAKGCRGCCSQ